MQFDPKYSAYLGIAVTVEIAISHGTIGFTNAIPATWIPAVVAWAGILAFVGSTIMTFMTAFSSAQPGPMVTPPPLDVAKKAAALVLAIGVSLALFGGDAYAQRGITPAPAAAPARPLLCDPLNLLPGCHVEVAADGKGASGTKPVELDIWQKIVSAALPDLDYASSLAAAAGTPGGGVRKQCWDALILANKQASGTGVTNPDGTVKPKPDPHLFTDVESLAEVLDNLAPKGPLWTACAGAAQLAGTSILTFINAAVTGAAGMSLLGVT